MKKLIFLLFFYYGTAWAEPPISIQPMPIFGSVIQTMQGEWFGMCGEATIRIAGGVVEREGAVVIERDGTGAVIERTNSGAPMENNPDPSFTKVSQVIVSLSPTKTITMKSFEQPASGVVCVNTQAGYRLLTWNNWWNNWKWHFDIVDMNTLEYLSPSKNCDVGCASATLENDIPKDIQSGEFSAFDYDKAEHMFPAVQ